MNQSEKLANALKSLEAYRECHLVPSYFLNALADLRAVLLDEDTPLCPVHKSLESRNNLELEIGNNCLACSLNERATLLRIIGPLAKPDGSEDSVSVLHNAVATLLAARQSHRDGKLYDLIIVACEAAFKCGDCDERDGEYKAAFQAEQDAIVNLQSYVAVAKTDAATRVRDRCVEKVKLIRDEVLAEFAAEFKPDGSSFSVLKREAVIKLLRRLKPALESLTLEGEQEKPK